MKITTVEARVIPAAINPRPIRDALQVLSGGGSVVVRITTDDGLVGEGSSYFGRLPGAAPTLKLLMDEELSPLVIGRDPFAVRQIHEDLKRETEYHGFTGLTMFGIAAIDTAL